MFPLFYKHCVIFDMGKYEKDMYELYTLPMVCNIRKVFAVIEVIGLAWLYSLLRSFEGYPNPNFIGKAPANATATPKGGTPKNTPSATNNIGTSTNKGSLLNAGANNAARLLY